MTGRCGREATFLLLSSESVPFCRLVTIDRVLTSVDDTAAGINVFSLLHTLLARQSMREMVDSQATPSISIRLTQDIPGGRYERTEDRAETRTTMRTSEREGSSLVRRTANERGQERLSEYLSDDDVEKGLDRPISVSRARWGVVYLH